MWMTYLSVRRPLVVLMAALALMIGGVIAYTRLPVDLLPQAQFPYVFIVTSYPGAGPREIEERLAKPIEEAVSGANGVKSVGSTSADGYALVSVEFQDGVNPDEAIREVERRVATIRGEFPDGAKDPTMSKFDPGAAPILNLALTSDLPLDQTYILADQVIRPRLESVPGVASVGLTGGLQREIKVRLDERKLAARGVSTQQVESALASANLSVPAGTAQQGGKEYSLRVFGLYQQVNALGDLVVASLPTGVVYLRDVATVEDGFQDPDTLGRVNQRDAVGLIIQKQATANTVSVAQGVLREVSRLETQLPGATKMVVVQDTAEFVTSSLNSLNANLRDAVIITALVLLLFLHTVRATIIVLVAIPTSLIATFGVMWLLGFTVNMMSTMALALTIGILVDDSIVILENIHRHLGLGEAPENAAIGGRAEIGAAAVAITLVDVVVYTPVAFMTGIVGQFFREFGITIVIATLFSLLVSFTLTPMLASRWLKAGQERRSRLAPLWLLWERGYEGLAHFYRRLLGGALRWRWGVVALGIAAFAAGLGLVGAGAVGTEFVPEADQSQFVITADMPPGTTLESTNRAVAVLEQRLASLPEISSFLTTVGVGGQFDREQHRSAKIYVRLVPKQQRQLSVKQVGDRVHDLAADIPDLTVRVNQPGVVGTTVQPIIVNVRGDDMDALTRLSSQVEAAMRQTPGVIDVNNTGATGSPELRLTIDHRRAADLGLTTAQVAATIRTAFEGNVVTQFRRENEDKVDIRLLSAESGTAAPASIPDIPLVTATGTRVKLSQVARMQQLDGPAEIGRLDRQRYIQLGANLKNRPLGDVSADLRREFASIEVPAGYEIKLAGDVQYQTEAFGNLGLALGISVLLIYMLLVALYNSFLHPLVIMFSLPVASVGAIGALVISGDTLNIMSMVGVVMLTGLVAKNAILLVDYTNTLRGRGYTRREAILEAGYTRLRPILMTTAAMVLAMTPLALKLGEGAEMRSSMAVVVIGGLLSSTLLTLVLVPAVYTILDDLRALFHRGKGDRTTTSGPDTVEERPAAPAVPHLGRVS